MARGRRARSRRRLVASGGTVVAVAALTLPLIATASPSNTPTAAPQAPSPVASPSLAVTPTPSPRTSPRPRTSPSGPPPGRVVLTAGCATADPGAAAEDEHGLPSNQNKLFDVYDRLNPVANRRFGVVYAGAAQASPRDRLMVYRKPSAEFDREFARDCVEVHDAAYSVREIRARADEVLADRAYWQRRNINPASFTFDITPGRRSRSGSSVTSSGPRPSSPPTTAPARRSWPSRTNQSSSKWRTRGRPWPPQPGAR